MKSNENTFLLPTHYTIIHDRETEKNTHRSQKHIAKKWILIETHEKIMVISLQARVASLYGRLVADFYDTSQTYSLSLSSFVVVCQSLIELACPLAIRALC